MQRYLFIVLVLLCMMPVWAQEEFDAHIVGHVWMKRPESTCLMSMYR